MQARIFVIHSENDRGILKKLINEYNEQTFGEATLQIRFLDSETNECLGEDFGKKIEEEINDSYLVIAIISPNSRTSTWVNQEIGYAKGKNKKIIPMKEKSMSREGVGFIHSNMDAQLFHYKQRKFLKLNRYFKRIFNGTRINKVLKNPIVKPVKEGYKLHLKRAEPDVV